MKEFKDWKEIKAWAEEHGFTRIAKRMQLNNDCWMSSGEFGRNQVLICDALRFADSEEDRLEIASDIENDLKDDILL